MDGLCLKAGIIGITAPITVVGGEIRANPPTHIVTAVGRTAASSISAEKPSISGSPSRRTAPWGFSLKYPLKSLWPGSNRNRHDAVAVDDAVSLDEEKEEKPVEEIGDNGGRDGNWVLKILHVRSLWKEENGEIRGDEPVNELDQESQVSSGDDEDGDDDECDACRVNCDEKIEFDKSSFSKLLRRVTLTEARLYAKMSYLGNLAYSIPQIKSRNLLKNHGLRFVTSSIEKKAQQALKAEKEKMTDEDVLQGVEEDSKKKAEEVLKPEKENEVVDGAEEELAMEAVELIEEKDDDGNRISALTAYHIAASAASYLHSHTKSILPFKSSKPGTDGNSTETDGEIAKSLSMTNADMVSLMATTDSVTAVVAAKEEVKQAVADDLNSTRSSPCEWFICDDDQTGTRHFVIQGSESLASWQANLLFEPIQFEALDVIVHRGIYEAAKGIYEQMLPEVRAHLKAHGDRATFRFTGHSLGGSLSLLVNLMLLIRGEVPRSSLLPVITFGAPSVMCGGDRLLRELGLPRSHLQAITMHRDIVPRAFSCNYPDRVAHLLKAVNANFRNHPCLNNQSLLYAPMGEFLILQPDAKFSPHHQLLPSGSGLYLLTSPVPDSSEAEKQVRAAQSVFLNTPHPLEILSDRSAYGSEGTIHRDHDMDSYLKSIRSVIRLELNKIRKERRELRRKAWWPLVAPRGVNSTSIVVGRPVVTNSGNFAQGQLNFSGMLQTGRDSLKRFTRLVASQHMHLLVVLLFPARLLVLESRHIINLG